MAGILELGGQSSQVINTFWVLAGFEAERKRDNILFCGLEVRERSSVGRGRSSQMSSHSTRSTKIEQIPRRFLPGLLCV